MFGAGLLALGLCLGTTLCYVLLRRSRRAATSRASALTLTDHARSRDTDSAALSDVDVMEAGRQVEKGRDVRHGSSISNQSQLKPSSSTHKSQASADHLLKSIASDDKTPSTSSHNSNLSTGAESTTNVSTGGAESILMRGAEDVEEKDGERAEEKEREGERDAESMLEAAIVSDEMSMLGMARELWHATSEKRERHELRLAQVRRLHTRADALLGQMITRDCAGGGGVGGDQWKWIGGGVWQHAAHVRAELALECQRTARRRAHVRLLTRQQRSRSPSVAAGTDTTREAIGHEDDPGGDATGVVAVADQGGEATEAAGGAPNDAASSSGARHASETSSDATSQLASQPTDASPSPLTSSSLISSELLAERAALPLAVDPLTGHSVPASLTVTINATTRVLLSQLGLKRVGDVSDAVTSGVSDHRTTNSAREDSAEPRVPPYLSGRSRGAELVWLAATMHAEGRTAWRRGDAALSRARKAGASAARLPATHHFLQCAADKNSMCFPRHVLPGGDAPSADAPSEAAPVLAGAPSPSEAEAAVRLPYLHNAPGSSGPR
jgi:hypothetical protein